MALKGQLNVSSTDGNFTQTSDGLPRAIFYRVGVGWGWDEYISFRHTLLLGNLKNPFTLGFHLCYSFTANDRIC